MEASTTVNKMLAGNRIFVPTYQRAYSWDTESESDKIPKQVNTFLSDLEDYNRSTTKSKYYFGHFLFEEKSENNFGVIDGQQRLTTIVIFLSAIFSKLKKIRALTEDEEVLFENMIKRKSNYIFSTVYYDNELFKHYVIDDEKNKIDKNGLETESAKRIVKAFDFFSTHLANKDESYLLKMLDTVQRASCTTHTVKDESEAIQMFIFQNNRGKKPSNLEIIKAQFMFNVHLYGGDKKDNLIENIKKQFEEIYRSISLIEDKIDEDDVLVYTLRVHFNSLWETNAIDKINKELSKNNPIDFIESFTESLKTSFKYLKKFFKEDEKDNIEIHSLITLGDIGIAIPFIIKAYKFGLEISKINKLCNKLESMVLRHRLIGTRADIRSRLNDVYKNFTSKNSDYQPIVDKIEYMKKADSKNADSWWWAYWNNNELERSIQGGLNHDIAKYLLWKYENYLKSQEKSDYKPIRFDKIIESPELEHIAPHAPTNGEPKAAGYCDYDEEFKNQYIECLGNYLLVSKNQNRSIGNKPFADKIATYDQLEQQIEIQKMTSDLKIWNKEKISQRKKKIVQFILDNF